MADINFRIPEPAPTPVEPTTNEGWRIAVAVLSVCALVACAVLLILPGILSRTAVSSFLGAFSLPKAWHWQAAPAVPVVVLPPEPVVPQPVLITTSTFLADTMSAPSWIVRDVTTGQILLSKNANERRSLASITKIVSALVILDTKPEWTTTTVAIGAWAEDPFILPGGEYTVKDLWTAALVGSSNRSIISLAHLVTPSTTEFAALMNTKALALGMHNTTLVEPSGLNARNISTAADVALLIAEAAKHPEITAAMQLRDFTIAPVGRAARAREIHFWNTDWLVLGWIPHTFAEIQAGKTGYIPEAGYNFAMQVANADGQALDVVSLGAESQEARFYDVRALANWVFDNYAWK